MVLMLVNNEIQTVAKFSHIKIPYKLNCCNTLCKKLNLYIFFKGNVYLSREGIENMV